MKPKLCHTFGALAILALGTAVSHAKSDTDVYLIKPTDVAIAEDTITIIGEALTRITTVSDNRDPNYAGTQIGGRPADSTYIKSDAATFVIQRPKEPGGGGGLWPDCIAAAKRLKMGEPTGRIAFYKPRVVIEGNLIVSITGHGYLMPNPEKAPPGLSANNAGEPGWAGAWRTEFGNGVNQHNTIDAKRTRGGNDHGWSSDGKVEVDGDQLMLTYDDDRVERWSRVHHRMVVEHWHPASGYPDGKPVVGIAQRAR